MTRFPEGPLLREFADLRDPMARFETGLRVAGARVVVADYALLQSDFPALSTGALVREYPELAALDPEPQTAAIHAHIDAWLVRNAAIVSTRQAEPNAVNTRISTTGERVKVVRPPRYGRALVAQAPEGGLLDIKGAGVQPTATPTTRVHQSGLMFLGEALGDLAFQRIIDRIFRHSGSRFWTLPIYGVLALGFDTFSGAGQASPAGVQVRRAHRRPAFGGDLPIRGTLEQSVKFEIEMILRHYGLTSCTQATMIARVDETERSHYTYGGYPTGIYTPEELAAIHQHIGALHSHFEGVNIQTIREVEDGPFAAQVVDFGHFEARRRFELPVVSLVSDRVMRWGGALTPEHPQYVQPNPALALPWSPWGAWECAPGAVHVPLPGTARHSGVDRLAFDLAARFVAGEVSGPEISAWLDALIDDTSADWQRRAEARSRVRAVR